MFASVFDITANSSDSQITLASLLIALGAALVLGLFQSVIYMRTHKDKNPSQSFALTLVMVPAVIAIIVLLVGSNIARAFSLAGVFAIIRFRSAPGDPKDIAYVLFSMAIGLSCGMGYIGYAGVVALVLGLAMLLLDALKFGKSRSTAKLLKITIPENLDYQDAFNDILSKYTTHYNLNKLRTTDLGSLYELVYAVETRVDLKEKDFLDELRCRNGNLNITLIMTPQSGEF
jgi:hypothetical protein